MTEYPGRVFLEEFSGTFLDPLSCGSSIRWSVTLSESGYYGNDPIAARAKRTASLSARMSLTDCNRCITWDLDDYAMADKKLMRAIEQLQLARRTIKKAKATHDKLIRGGELLKSQSDE